VSVRYRRVNYQYAVSTGAGWLTYSSRAIAPARWRPPADLVETAHEVEITVEIPGVEEDDLSIILFENAVVVEGERRRPSHSADCRFHSAEIKYGPFRLEVSIPGTLHADRVIAEYTTGMLRIVVPRPAAGTA
jgi:HSP20 family protein